VDISNAKMASYVILILLGKCSFKLMIEAQIYDKPCFILVGVLGAFAADGIPCLSKVVANKTLTITCYERVDVTDQLTAII
jgi:hypothetical protein